MAKRTQLICLHEGKQGRSIDPLFIRVLIKKLRPAWIRQWDGSNVLRTVAYGGRTELIQATPRELRAAASAGAATTLMVWADVDDDMASPEALREAFWQEAKANGISAEDFGRVVFAFAKDRLENWVEYLNTGATAESREGPRVKDAEARDAALKLAELCRQQDASVKLPPSLQWSCRNWQALNKSMK